MLLKFNYNFMSIVKVTKILLKDFNLIIKNIISLLIKTIKIILK